MGRRMFLKRTGAAGVMVVLISNGARLDVRGESSGTTRKYLVCVVEPEGWDNARALFVDTATGEKIDKSLLSGLWRRARSELSGSGARKGDIGNAFNITVTNTVIQEWLKTGINPPEVRSRSTSTTTQQAITHDQTTVKYTPNPSSNTATDNFNGEGQCRVEIKDAIAAGLATVSNKLTDIGQFTVEWGPVKWTSPTLPSGTEVSSANTTLNWGFVLMTYQEYLNWCSANSISAKQEPINAVPPSQ